MADNYGAWAWLIGIILVLAMSFLANPWIAVIVGILALIIGLLNVSKTEQEMAVWWIIALGVVGIGALGTALAGLPGIGTFLQTFLTNLGLFFTVIAAVLLIKIGWDIFSG